MLSLILFFCTAASAVTYDCDNNDTFNAWNVANSSDCTGDHVCIHTDWFHGETGGKAGVCGTVGPYGGGCTTADDCPSFLDSYVMHLTAAFFENDDKSGAVCKNGQCLLANGAACVLSDVVSSNGFLTYQETDVGYQTDGCASGFCERIFRSAASCQLFANYTEGCTADTDCMVGFPNDFDFEIDMRACVDGECKLIHGSSCVDFPYPSDNDLCKGGYCMSEALLGAEDEPSCRSFGDNGTCTTNDNCNYTILGREGDLQCIDSRCVIPTGGPCGEYSINTGSDWSFTGFNISFHGCQGGGRCIENGTVLEAVCEEPSASPTSSPTVPTGSPTASPTVVENGALRIVPFALAAAVAFL